MVGAMPPMNSRAAKLPSCRCFMESTFDLHDFAQQLGVGAIDHELHALARELVVDLVDVGFEGEQAFAPRLVGHVQRRGRRSRRNRGLCRP